MKIQPIDFETETLSIRTDRTELTKPVAKSRFKRLFERQFSNVLRISSSEKLENKDVGSDLEPSSVCLAKMVQNFMEEGNEKQKCGRSRCSCFNGNCTDSSDDEYELCRGFGDSINADACEILKSLVPCTSSVERNLLADTSKIVEKNNKICKQKDEFKKIVSDGLVSLGYNASICKSRWEKSPTYPSGDYEYVDVIIDDERVLIDIDFRSEFEIARSTSYYRSILQTLPLIFVGKADRVKEIVSIVSEAAKQSLKKKGMPLPPWRKVEYMRAKWLSPYNRTNGIKSIESSEQNLENENQNQDQNQKKSVLIQTKSFSGEFELFFAARKSEESYERKGSEEKITVVVSPWKPPAIKPKMISQAGAKIGSGLSSVLKEK